MHAVLRQRSSLVLDSEGSEFVEMQNNNNKNNRTEHRTLTDPSVSTIDNDLDRRKLEDRRNKWVSLLAQD